MALITSAATGNFNAGATWTGGVVPGVGDEAQAANGHTITITANVACTELSNAGTGIFTLNDGVTLTANVTNKSTTTSRNCLQFTAAFPASASIVGNITGGTVTGAFGVRNAGTGTLNITGNVTAGSGNSAYGVWGIGIISVTGNVTGGSAAGASSAGILSDSAASVFSITGNVTGGTVNSTNYGFWNFYAATVTITGNVTGESVAAGIFNTTTGSITITGLCTAGAKASGAVNSSTGTINIGRAVGNAYGPGNTAGLSAAAGATNSALGVIEIQEFEYGTYGMSPTSGTGIRLKKASTNVAKFNYCNTAGAKTLIDATANAAMPAATDVRSGVSYASGALTGSCAVPAAGSVALSVAVDATTGTAILTQANVQSALTAQGLTTARAGNLDNLDAAISSRLAPDGTLATVTTLTNAPTVPSASAIASQVRTELSVELARVDQNISSRLAAADYTAPSAAPTVTAIRQEMDANSTQLAAIKVKTDALNTTRLGQVATTEIVGNLLAQANS